MSTNKYDYLSNVQKGRTDWRVKVRIIREWRGKNVQGQPLEGFNLILLDAKNVRMQAFVPGFLSEKIKKLFTVGRMYAITNFQVKDYTEKDKWRCVNMDRQILFTNATKSREMDDHEYFIAENMFDFFECSDLKLMAKQNLYLADVVGVVIKKDGLRLVRNRHGQDQVQLRMKMTDGSTTINVVLWEKMAEEFEEEINKNQYEEPIILIISSGKIGYWKDELDICNFSPTAYYINYNHHSVVELRKMVAQSDFVKSRLSLTQPKKKLRLCSVDQIKKLGEDFIQEEVICQVNITHVEEAQTWFYTQCTTCYKQIDKVDGNYVCTKCNNRIVPHPDKKFGICILGADETGDIQILLMDRPMRQIFGKTVFDMEGEGNGKFPAVIKTLERNDYTMKLLIAEFNIKNRDEMYFATDMFKGFKLDEEIGPDYSAQQHTEYSVGESATTQHLDDFSQGHI